MQFQATLPVRARFGECYHFALSSELTAEELEIWRLWGLSKEFVLSGTTPPVSAPDVKSLMSSPVSWRAVALGTQGPKCRSLLRNHMIPYLAPGLLSVYFQGPSANPASDDANHPRG
jgi:hypothetical protein